jgi:peptidoglycan/xylan/chitin deacetylase (PgdA/CDA1 family)
MNDEQTLWPGGASAAVTLTFDVDAEAGLLGDDEKFARRLTSLSEGRYGVTRGVPRILDLLRRYDIPATFFVPGYVAEQHPDLVETLLTAGHEVGHHGYMHLRSHLVSAQAQADEIVRGFETLEKAGAPRPAGYRSTAWEMTPETFGLLIDHGFRYDSSCMGDDRPYIEHWDGQSILEIPVHWSLDDWPYVGWSLDGGGNAVDPAEMIRSWTAEFESARAERRHTSFTMHPEAIGRPYRLAHLEKFIEHVAASCDVWFARLDQVADRVAPSLIGASTATH